jgi:hypothetical protein
MTVDNYAARYSWLYGRCKGSTPQLTNMGKGAAAFLSWRHGTLSHCTDDTNSLKTYLPILPWIKHVHRQHRCSASTCCCHRLMVVQAQVVPEPHQGRLAATWNTRGARATTSNAPGELQQ